MSTLKRFSLVTILVVAVALSHSMVTAKRVGTVEDLIEEGERIFFNETFNGNGRTCGTCHPAENNLSIDPKFIAMLPPDDPLFVAEFNPDLADLERPELMRQFGLILENLDGFDQPGVMRCVPHLFSLNLTVQPRPDNVAKAGFGDSTGWSGDGQALELPGGVTTNGTLREFTIGAVFQHFPKTLKRVPGEDFRLPTDEELVAIEAFLRSLGRQNEIDLDGMTFQSPVVEQGKILFNSTAKCFMCHENAGAINFNSVNGNANTGIEDQIGLPNKLIDPTVPRDGGFGVEPDGMDGLGDGTFSVPPLIEAAVGFYNSRAFNDSPAGQFVGGISLDGSQVVAIASLLRMLNALENIRLSNVQDEKAKAAKLHRGRELLAVSIADTQDAIEVLTGGEFFLYRRAVGLLKETLFLEKFARHVGIGRRNRLLDRAIRKKEEARALIVDEG